jgi:hypothetical protein
MLSRMFVAVLGLSFLCAPAALGGPDGAKKGEKKEHRVRGVVESVQKDKDKDTGSILINVRAKKKAAPAEGDRDRKFYVTEDTKFEKLIFSGKGEKPQREPASFKDVVKGEHVAIVPSDDKKDVARAVAILVRKK